MDEQLFKHTPMSDFIDAGASVYVSGGEVRIEVTEAQFNTAIDAVVASVRADAARDIRAAGEMTSWSREHAEHAARIAEGATDAR